LAAQRFSFPVEPPASPPPKRQKMEPGELPELEDIAPDAELNARSPV
jgi:hypothetical protein